MSEIKTVSIKCACSKCTSVFTVTVKDAESGKDLFCSSSCSDITKIKNQKLRNKNDRVIKGSRSNLCQNKVTDELMGLRGSIARGEVIFLLPGERQTARGINRSGKTKSTLEGEKIGQSLPKKKNSSEDESENTTSEKKPEKINTERKIVSTSTECKGSGMQETKKNNETKLTSEGGELTQQSDSSRQSLILHQEKSSSLKLLNDSAEHLQDLAKSLAKPRKTDENGEVIQRCPTHEIEVAIRCLTEARNIMKTKLDFLKFGKDLIDSNKK